jgi:endonuclease V-like protein UPF0215 family
VIWQPAAQKKQIARIVVTQSMHVCVFVLIVGRRIHANAVFMMLLLAADNSSSKALKEGLVKELSRWKRQLRIL